MTEVYAPCFGWEGDPKEGIVYTDLRRLRWLHEDYQETAAQCYAGLESIATTTSLSGNIMSNSFRKNQDFSSGRGEGSCCGFGAGTACGAGGPDGNNFIGYDHEY